MALVLPFTFRRPVHPLGNVSLLASQRRTVGLTTRLWTDLISRSATFGTGATGFGNCLNGGYGEGTATDGSDVIPISTTQTIDCRFLLPSTPGGTVVLWGINGGSGGLYLGVTSGGVLTVSTGTTSYNGVTVVNDNAWHHVRLVLNGTSGSLLYLDGNSENSLGTALSISPSSTFQLGAFIGSFQWPGSLDEFAVWNSPLVGTFTPPTAPYAGTEPGLVSLYHVDGDVKAALVSSGTSSTGTGASTEDADTTAASGTVSIAITGASTETADTAAGIGALSITGTGASTESTDTTSASGTAAISASGASTEGTDTTAAAGAVTASATGASTEGTDTTSATGTIPVAASGASTERSDISSGAAAVSVAASGASTEGTDNSSGSGTVAQSGSTGIGAGVETHDATSGAALTLVSGTGSALEAADTCAGTGSTLSISFGHIKLWMGTSFSAKPVKVWNGVTWVTKPLKYWTGTAWRATSY